MTVVFALYLHVCTQTLMTSRGAGSGIPHLVTACFEEPTGKFYASQDLCDRDGKAAVAGLPTGPDADTARKVDAYVCRQQSLIGQ